MLALVINPNASSEYVPYVLSVCGLLRKVNDLDKNNVKAIIKIEGILKDYKSRNSTPDQQELLKNIKDSLVDIITGIAINETIDDENGEFVTFGENLYTILRNGFFLEEGTIGEIAINKSESISKALN